MSDYVQTLMAEVKANNPCEPEFHQAVQEVAESLRPVLESRPDWREARILERLIEPERVIMFRVPWLDDQGRVRINRGFRVEMNGAIGPYKGGLRFHPSVDLGILKFLALEQVLKNSLTTLPMGGAQGGSNFNPRGMSDHEVMRFCQSFMIELQRHIGPQTDIPTGDMGVGGREIGYLFGQYRRIRNEFSGVMTGKGLDWGGAPLRLEATGYGTAYFAAEMLATRGDSLEGKSCLVSGSGTVAQHTIAKLTELGAKVLTASDSSGHIYDPEGIDAVKATWLTELKTKRRGRMHEFAEKFPSSTYTPRDAGALETNPVWGHTADCAFPCATQNELGAADARELIENGVSLVCEGATMPTTPQAARMLIDAKLLYGPGKAAGAGGAAVSGLEVAQNSMRLAWTSQEVDERLRAIMRDIHHITLEAADEYGFPGNYLAGANMAGFIRVANAMLDQGIV